MVADIPYSDATPGVSVPHKIVPYIATYDLMREAKIAGQAKRKLEPLADNNWLLTMNAKANVLLLNFKYTQKTKFKFINDRPRPENYQQIDSGSLKSSKKLKQVFDWQQMLESGRYNKKKWQLDLLPETQNRLTSLINLRVDLLSRNDTSSLKENSFIYPISYKGKINHDIYTILAEETLSTPAGVFETLKVQKSHKSKSRVSYYWLARKLDFLPVRIQQIKGGKEQANMLLQSVSFR